jgi:hypothetical protein
MVGGVTVKLVADTPAANVALPVDCANRNTSVPPALAITRSSFELRWLKSHFVTLFCWNSRSPSLPVLAFNVKIGLAFAIVTLPLALTAASVLVPLALSVVNAPAAGVDPPIAELLIVPPVIVALLVESADTPLIVPPVIAALFDESAVALVIAVLEIDPPVTAMLFVVSAETVLIVPPVMATLLESCVAMEPRPRRERAVTTAVASNAVAPAFTNSGRLPLPESVGSLAKPASTAVNSPRMVAEAREELVDGTPLAVKYSVVMVASP